MFFSHIDRLCIADWRDKPQNIAKLMKPHFVSLHICCNCDSIDLLVSSCLQETPGASLLSLFRHMPKLRSKASAQLRFLCRAFFVSAVACSEPALRVPVAYRSGIVLVMLCSRVSFFAYLGAPRWPRARLTVARPLARPTPRPRVPRDLNMGAFL